MLLQATPSGSESESKSVEEQTAKNSPEKSVELANTHILDYAPAPGWTTHVTKEGRLYYCKNLKFKFGTPDYVRFTLLVIENVKIKIGVIKSILFAVLVFSFSYSFT
ncbi:hypothetical protein FQR65_LT09121 [Abscondita terminalis]|nr:hypothetical protein FQR65_LT09121 [Abscondita terminalis]